MADITEILARRRTSREFKSDAISSEELNLILKAGQLAPTGGNSQGNHFIVIQNKKILDELENLIQQEFKNYKVTDDTVQNIKNAVNLSQKGGWRFFYNAPTLIVVATSKKNLNGFVDAACSMQNMMLEASELHIANCWINQLRWLDDNEVLHKYLEQHGLEKDEVVRASLALGYPAGKIPGPRTEITGMKITFIN